MLKGYVMSHLFCKALTWIRIAWRRRDFGPCQCLIYADLAPGQPHRNDIRFCAICLHFKYYWDENMLSVSRKIPGYWTCLTYFNSDWNLCIPARRDAWIAMGPSRPPVPALATTCKTLCTLYSTKLEISSPLFQHTMLRGYVMCHLFYKALTWILHAWRRRYFGPNQCLIYADLAPGQPSRNDIRFYAIYLDFQYYWDRNM